MKKIKNLITEIKIEKIKKLVTKIRVDAYIRILIELILGTLLFNVNSIVGILFLVIMTTEIIFSNTENCLYMYIFLSFFDEVLQNKYLGGSISRVLMIVIAIKLFFNIIRQKLKPNKKEIGILGFFLFSFIIGLITYKTISIEVIIIIFNILIFVLFSMNIKLDSKSDIDAFLENLFVTIVIALLNSILYGILNNSFLKEIDGTNIIYRFKGTYEPNFMSLFINLGIISLLAIKGKKISKKLSYILCAIMIQANIMTVSMTGIATMAIIMILYFIFNRKNLKKEVKDIGIILMLTIIIFTGGQIYKKILNNTNNTNFEETETSLSENKNEESTENLLENEKEENTENLFENINEENISNNHIKIPDETNIVNEEKSDLEKRIEFLKEILNNGDLDRFTSGRLPLAITFMKASFNRPLINILFGNDATTKKLFSDYFYGEKYSHNSYMDVLYNFGIIGFIISISYIMYITIKNKYLKNVLNDSYYNNTIKLIRIMLLIFAFSLSLYTKRMFLVFFLL